MRKIVLITLNDLRRTFTDRTLVLLMFAAPLALATIISVTFGDLASDGSPVSNVPVAVVNHDEGSAQASFGRLLMEVLVPAEGRLEAGEDLSGRPTDCRSLLERVPPAGEGNPNAVSGLIRGVEVADREAARACVEAGVFTAALYIPPDFSSRLTAGTVDLETGVLEVFGNQGRPIAVGLVETVVRGIADQFAAGAVAAASVLATAGPGRLPLVLQSDAFRSRLAGFQEGRIGPAIEVDRRVVTAGGWGFNPLVFFGSTQAIFFAFFAANGGGTAIREEHRDGTIQRLLVTPTRAAAILLGKALGIFVMIVVQLLFLFLAFTFIAALFTGELVFIWGTNVVGVAATLVSASLAVAGLGIIIAASVKNLNQGSILGSVVALAMATIGGAFGFQVGPPISYVSIVYWGSDAFAKLAAGEGAYGANLVVMTLFGVATFFIGLGIFHRRFAR